MGVVGDVIYKSTYENIQDFLKGKNVNNMLDCCLFLSSSDRYQKQPPNQETKDFIEQIFSNELWADFVMQQRRPKQKYFNPRPPFDFDTITSILNFEVIKMASLVQYETVTKVVTKIQKINKREQLKKDLKQAMEQSVFNGTFDKIDGFINLYEVLIKHNLLEEYED